MRRVAIVVTVLVAAVVLAAPGASAQPKVTITGFVDNVTSWNQQPLDGGSQPFAGDRQGVVRPHAGAPGYRRRGRDDEVRAGDRDRLRVGSDGRWRWQLRRRRSAAVRVQRGIRPEHRRGRDHGDQVGVHRVRGAAHALPDPDAGRRPALRGHVQGRGARHGRFRRASISRPSGRRCSSRTSRGSRKRKRARGRATASSVGKTSRCSRASRSPRSRASTSGRCSCGRTMTASRTASDRRGRGGVGTGGGDLPARARSRIDSRPAWTRGGGSAPSTSIRPCCISGVNRQQVRGGVLDQLNKDAWYLDIRGGWQAGPLLLEAVGIYTTGNKAEDRIDVHPDVVGSTAATTGPWHQHAEVLRDDQHRPRALLDLVRDPVLRHRLQQPVPRPGREPGHRPHHRLRQVRHHPRWACAPTTRSRRPSRCVAWPARPGPRKRSIRPARSPPPRA